MVRGIVGEQAIADPTNTLTDQDRPGMGVGIAPAVNDWRDLTARNRC